MEDDSDPPTPQRGTRTRIIRPRERRSVSRSATRALDLLELFGRVRRPLRAVEIARTLSLPPSTADQLLKSMVESAHLTFDAVAKIYQPSPRLTQFGAWMIETYGPDERLRGLVRDLHAATGMIATLTTPNGMFMQIIDFAGEATSDALAERGLRISIFGSAIGAAFLATLREADVAQLKYSARVNPRDFAIIQAQIDTLRRTGAADGPTENGSYWSVAAPLRSDSLPAPFVLGLAGVAIEVTSQLETFRAQLLAAISRWRSSLNSTV